MRSKITICIALFFILITNSFSQVTFTSRPLSLQLYPRSFTDSAMVSIVGKVIVTGYTKAIFTYHKNGVIIDSTISNLTYSSNKANFTRSYTIHAEKSLNRFTMYLYNGSSVEVLRADSVCSGDVFLINGQSNATALLNTTVSDTIYTWVRSFGTNSPVATECTADTTWGLAISGTGTHHAGIGVWAYRLGKMIADSTGIPVCFINAAKFGSRIADHLPVANNHADINSVYGRLLFRAKNAIVTSAIKALFWYQGESDGDSSAAVQYANRFSILYNSWKMDYPGLRKIIVMQTRPGCNTGTTFNFHQQLRETVRNFPKTYSDVSLMTTTAIPDYDGCHFLYTGYYQLALQLYNQLSDDLYNKPASANSDPPSILKAWYSNNSNTELSLLFDQPVVWQGNLNGKSLKDYFYLNSTTTISSGYSVNDTIKLQLSASSNATRITYLPGIYYSGTTVTYQGPWLVNNSSIGIPSFYQFPITNSLTINGSFCTFDSIPLSTNRIGQVYQWYRNGTAIVGANSSQVIAVLDGIYTLTMKDADSISISSNTISVVNQKRVPVITSTSGLFSFCSGSSVTLVCDAIATNFQWYKSGVAIANTNSSTATISATGSYSVWMQDANGCTATSSTVTITTAANAIASYVTTNQYNVCKDTVTTLTGNTATGYTYQWQKNSLNIPGATDKIYNTNYSGVYRLLTTNNLGCTKTSGSIVIPVVNPVATLTASAPNLCVGETVTLTANSGSGYTYLWFMNYSNVVGASGPTFAVTTAATYGVRVTNAIGCTTNSPPKVITYRTDCGPPRSASAYVENSLGILLYPDPFTSAFTIQLSDDELTNSDLVFELYNAKMSKVKEINKLQISHGGTRINADDISSGIYFYRLVSNEKIYFGKVIKN